MFVQNSINVNAAVHELSTMR